MSAVKLAYSKASAPSSDETYPSVGVASGLDNFAVLSAATDDGFNHVCQRDGHQFEAEMKSAYAIAQSNQVFFDNPLQTVLGAEAIVQYTCDYNSSTIKSVLLDGLDGYLTSQKSGNSLKTSVLNCADEIYTNSLYNAPFVDLYTQRNPGVGRDRTSVFLAKQHMVYMSAGRYQDRVALVCRDPFGSLNVEMFLKRIKNTHEVGAGRAMNFGAGGAGLGSYIIFNECSSLYVAATPGVATVIACVFPIGMSGLQRQSLVKHLHWVTAVRE